MLTDDYNERAAFEKAAQMMLSDNPLDSQSLCRVRET